MQHTIWLKEILIVRDSLLLFIKFTQKENFTQKIPNNHNKQTYKQNTIKMTNLENLQTKFHAN